ncbi:cyclic peptide transporter [[Clostridium] cellulosi]|uniref:Cyclic peptide transporter n=1 Tax=[Clostridium] cellulosi TaxID=29343 RepID=A0A078KNE8_9FIRM|nr:cyclic peptide transporter [[Clostridium] cellulosi]
MFDNDLSLIVFWASIAVNLLLLYFIGDAVVKIVKEKRKFKGHGINGLVAVLLSTITMLLSIFCLYEIPQILYNGYNWAMIWEIGPDALIRAAISLSVLAPLLYIYFLISFFFEKPDDKPYFLIITMSVLSGFGNSMMVFIVNEALNRTLNDTNHAAGIETGLYVYFILGLLFFTAADYYTRKRMIVLTNRMIFEKRMKIIDKIFGAPFYNFESMDHGKTYAALNNDPETVSNFVNMFVQILTGSVSLIFCFVYLWTLNGEGAFLSIVIIVIASALFMLVSHSAQKAFEKNRDVQNLFFKNISDLVGGFKELYINGKKRSEFHDDIQNSCKMYTDTRIEGDIKFVGVTIFGNIMYMLVIGIVAFTFSMIFPYIQSNTLRSFVVVYLYMGSIITMLTSQIPSLVRVMVSFRRIESFINEISTLKEEPAVIFEEKTSDIKIQLKNVKFHYKNTNGEEFSLGPINYEFRSGEIVFITGGNGSGKTTLAKLITGLYQPDEGEILVNGEKVDTKTLGNYFTTVYSDFYLFDRLYGINTDEKMDEIKKYLDILKISDKVSIKDGKFTTTRLSTGQKKRLALLISYLEDKPAFFFDEWAADQDPEFRKFFYTTLLPELKARGKAVIAITHDDRYFGEADKLIKMEMGQIIDQNASSYAVSGGKTELA